VNDASLAFLLRKPIIPPSTGTSTFEEPLPIFHAYPDVSLELVPGDPSTY
jgi:hypothetical protein